MESDVKEEKKILEERAKKKMGKKMGSCVLTISGERTTRHILVHCVMIKQAKNKYLTNCAAIPNCRTLYVVDLIAGDTTAS